MILTELSREIDIKNSKNLSDVWLNQGNNPITSYCADQDEYIRLFKKHFKDFSGTVLEIGPGTGYLCKHIVNNYDVEFSILETEKNINYLKENYLKEEKYNNINYIVSNNYRDIFLDEYDLLVSTFCLPETPEYYWKDILDNIRVKNCFIIDDGMWCNYEDARNNWLYNTFDSCNETEWIYTIKGYHEKGIQISIGKNKGAK